MMRRTDSQHISLILKSENTFLNYTKYHTNIKELILYILQYYINIVYLHLLYTYANSDHNFPVQEGP